MKTILTTLLLLTALNTFGQRNNLGNTDYAKRDLGIGLMIGGVAFTTAAILQGGYQYGTYVTTKPATATSSATQVYVIPPVWKQTPRNITFVVGVGITITGLLTIKQ